MIPRMKALNIGGVSALALATTFVIALAVIAGCSRPVNHIPEGAEKVYLEMLKEDPGDGGAMVGLARNRRDQKKYEEGLEWLEKAESYDASYSEIYRFKMELLDNLGRTDESVDAALKYFELYEDAPAWFVADYAGKEDAMIYSTGFEVNLGVVSCLTGREDYILWDEQDHASIIEGRRLSFSQSLKYRHNDMASLEAQLKRCNPDKVKLIVTDGVFSMEGDVCKLPDIVDLARKYDASIMVDEAHGIGVFGKGGRGVCDHFGLTDEVDLIMGTFSKSFASLGGFIATDEVITNYLRHHSRSYIFTASITPAATAAVSAALDIMIAEPERQERLWENTHYALEGFRQMGCEIGHTETPIIPLFIRDNNLTFLITRELLDEGIFVNPVVSPAVAPNDTLIRFSLMATHTREQVTVALEKIQKVFRSHNLIP